VNHYDPVTIGKRQVNANGKHERHANSRPALSAHDLGVFRSQSESVQPATEAFLQAQANAPRHHKGERSRAVESVGGPDGQAAASLSNPTLQRPYERVAVFAFPRQRAQ